MTSVAPRLYAITDRTVVAGDLADAAAAAFAAGVDWLQVREKEMAARAQVALVRRIVAAARPHGARVMVNGRIDVAIAAGADGVHLTEVSVAVDDVRRTIPELKIGVSVHTLAGARVAADGGADFVLFGPVFATPSKASYGPPQGLDRLAVVCRSIAIPVVAVGGIDPLGAVACRAAGAHGVAAIRGIFAATDIAAAVRAMLGS